MIVFPTTAVLDLHKEQALVERSGVVSGPDNRGRITASTSSTFVIELATYIATGEDLDAVPEADRTSEVRVFVSTTRLRTRPADLVTVRAATYKLMHREDYDADSRTYRYWGTRQ